jgi:hypothetical protein
MPGSAPLPLVHLVGSVPYDTAEANFTNVAQQLPNRLERITDGEPGERGIYVYWQSKVFPKEILFNNFSGVPPPDVPENFQLKLEDIKPTEYDDAAIASYSTFRRLREANVIPPGVRFQVSLPTPLNGVCVWVNPKAVAAAEPLYEQRIMSALANILANIPAQDLAIQWDVACEMAHMEHAYGPHRPDFQVFKPYYSPVKEGIVDRLTRLAGPIEKSIPVGFHFCYGDFHHQHFVQPKDSSQLVDLINAVTKSVTKQRPVNWVHLPVPKDFVDDAYFGPLSHLDIEDTTIFLGLVHAHDPEGGEKRIEAAKKALGDKGFGVSTECGLGRTPLEDLDSIFEIFRDVTQQI